MKANGIKVLLIIALVAIYCASCGGIAKSTRSSSKGASKKEKFIIHVVKPGESLWSIGNKYDVSHKTIADFNDIDNARSLKPGKILKIPRNLVENSRFAKSSKSKGKIEGAKSESSTGTRVASLSHRLPTSGRGAQSAPPPRRGGNPNAILIWPTQGVLYSSFGARAGRMHSGLDISAPIGAKIVAAGNGEVIYAGRQGGYGNIIIIKHSAELVTVYAHNQENLVREGQNIRKGQEIGRVGQTGRATGPHVHFEVRIDTKPVNPLKFLP
jgi:murein DD-endopeptidase MepM/ murein hydrolase activator NlpD